MSDLFYREKTSYWVVALAGSLVVHGAGLAMALDVLPGWPRRELPMPANITIETLVMTPQQIAVLANAEPDDTDPPGMDPAPALPDPDDGPSVEVEPPGPEPVDPPGPVEPELPVTTPPDPPPGASLEPNLAPPPEVTENPLLPDSDTGGNAGYGTGTGTSMAPPALALGTDPDSQPDIDLPPPPPPPPPPPGGQAPLATLPPYIPPPPPNQTALQGMVDRIRSQIDKSCLLALPQIDQANAAVQLMVLSDNDLTTRDFAEAVLADPELQISHRAVLMDRRQCPALDFLRARAEYPAFRLSIGVASREIMSGGRLIGRVEGITAGQQTTLLLVDDNGVVQDLRRFLRINAGTAEFDVPVTRDGDSRDTSQMLIALVTPDRLNTVTNLAGREAEEFFAALGRELGPAGALAVIPLDIR